MKIFFLFFLFLSNVFSNEYYLISINNTNLYTCPDINCSTASLIKKNTVFKSSKKEEWYKIDNYKKELWVNPIDVKVLKIIGEIKTSSLKKDNEIINRVNIPLNFIPEERDLSTFIHDNGFLKSFFKIFKKNNFTISLFIVLFFLSCGFLLGFIIYLLNKK